VDFEPAGWIGFSESALSGGHGAIENSVTLFPESPSLRIGARFYDERKRDCAFNFNRRMEFRMFSKRSIPMAPGLGLAAALFLIPLEADAKARSNTQARLPNKVYLADINGDGLDDVLEFNGTKIVARRSDFAGTVILDDYLTLDSRRAKRVITGDFTYAGRREKGKDQVCAILSDNNLACYAISDDGRSMWWWFTQGTFIADNEEAIVGDWTGDGADDILVYRPSDGNLRLYSLQTSGFFFQQNTNFDLGNLASLDLRNKQLRAGDFGQQSPRPDLLVLTPGNGQVLRYDAVTYNGKTTFWWAFTTNGGMVSTDEDFTVAKIDNDGLDDVALYNRRTGGYRFFQAAYSSGWLRAISNVGVGQLPQSAGGRLFWGKFAKWPSEPGGLTRDDAFFFSGNSVVRTDSRWTGSAFTYWWAYTKTAPKYTNQQRTLYDLSSAQRLQLSNLMRTYLTEAIITEHANGHDWHHATSESFFYQHRGFITRAERFLVNNGGSLFVPMPMWNPATTIPSEFTWVKANADGSPRPALTNLSPNRPMPTGLASPAVCSYATGSDLVGAVNGWHGGVHITVGGTMANAEISPAAVIFWPWHAFVDNIYARWQDCR
jgi:hypothetical protein